MTISIGRREFTAALGGTAFAWPLAAYAQQGKIWRVGVLDLGNADAQSFSTELREGLRKTGYIEGQNIEYAFRSSDNIANLPTLAAVFIVSGSGIALAAILVAVALVVLATVLRLVPTIADA
jgi:hypothetical protein